MDIVRKWLFNKSNAINKSNIHCYSLQILHIVRIVMSMAVSLMWTNGSEFNTSITISHIHQKYDTFDDVTNGTECETLISSFKPNIYDWCVQ